MQLEGDYRSVSQAAKQLGITKWGVYKKIYAKKIPCVRVGHTHLVDMRYLREYRPRH